jgi:hypothetical protein
MVISWLVHTVRFSLAPRFEFPLQIGHPTAAAANILALSQL